MGILYDCECWSLILKLSKVFKTTTSFSLVPLLSIRWLTCTADILSFFACGFCIWSQFCYIEVENHKFSLHTVFSCLFHFSDRLSFNQNVITYSTHDITCYDLVKKNPNSINTIYHQFFKAYAVLSRWRRTLPSCSSICKCFIDLMWGCIGL